MIITGKIYKKSRLSVKVEAVLALPNRLFPLRRFPATSSNLVQQRLLRLYSYILIIGRKSVDRKNPVIHCFFKRERVVVGFDRNSLVWSGSWESARFKGLFNDIE